MAQLETSGDRVGSGKEIEAESDSEGCDATDKEENPLLQRYDTVGRMIWTLELEARLSTSWREQHDSKHTHTTARIGMIVEQFKTDGVYLTPTQVRNKLYSGTLQGVHMARKGDRWMRDDAGNSDLKAFKNAKETGNGSSELAEDADDGGSTSVKARLTERQQLKLLGVNVDVDVVDSHKVIYKERQAHRLGAASKKRKTDEPGDGGGASAKHCTKQQGVAVLLPPAASGGRACVHQRRKRQCNACSGSSMCVHQRRRSNCKDCGGTNLCEHQRQRSRCTQCGGIGICEHQRVRSKCKVCGGSRYVYI